MQQSDVDYHFRFLGYGQPQQPLWFVGIEPGGDAGAKPQPDAYSSDGENLYHRELPERGGPESSPLWTKYARLSELLHNGENYFISNIAPLPRRNVNSALQGIDTWNNYRRRVMSERLPMIWRALNKYRPRAVVIHGKSAWNGYDVQRQWGLEPLTDRLNFHESNRLLFCNFLLRGFTNNDRDVAAPRLQQWLAAAR